MKQFYPIVLIAFVMLSTTKIYAQSTLNAGDIAITTLNTSGNQTFSFITFVSISNGTEIYLTDQGWDTTTDNFGTANEGTIIWTATSTIPSLTEIIIQDASTTISANTGSVSKSGTFDLADIGDQILVYQEESNGTPNFLYLFNRGSEIAEYRNGIRSSQSETMLPPGLDTNSTIFTTTLATNNWQYACTGEQRGNKDTLLTLFLPVANYNQSNTTTYLNGVFAQSSCRFVLNNTDNRNPIINPQTFSVREDAPIDHPIAVPTVDDGANSQFRNWRIIGGADQDKFSINTSTGMITVKDNTTFDFENINTRNYRIIIEVDDVSGNSSQASASPNGHGHITINVEDYESTITVSGSPTTIQEGATGNFTFTVSNPSLSPVPLSIPNYAGQADSGIDYETGPNSITIPANASSFILSIKTITDTTNETDEDIQIVTFFQDSSEDDITLSLSGFARFIIGDSNSLSIADNQFSKELKLYPNPSTDKFYIDSNTKNELQFAELFTMRGKLVETFQLRNMQRQELNLSAISNGTYILKIHGKNAIGVKQLSKLN